MTLLFEFDNWKLLTQPVLNYEYILKHMCRPYACWAPFFNTLHQTNNRCVYCKEQMPDELIFLLRMIK